MTFNKNNTRGGQTYETPSVTTLEVLSEGVLCGSGALKINDWENDEDVLEF